MLNKSKGNMYPWITDTFNIIKGACYHDCSYCYMKRYGQLKPVRFDTKELKTDLGSGNFIFIGSSCDMFAEDIPDEWIQRVFDHCAKFDNSYLFQTKNTERFVQFRKQFPKNTVLCTTIETNRWMPDIMNKSPSPNSRSLWFSMLKEFDKYITIEPIMDFDLYWMESLIRNCNPIQVNIGADSGGNKLPEPSKEKLLALIDRLKKFTVIDNKRNLGRILNK